MMVVLRVALMCLVIYLLHAIPTWLNDAVNALPQPLPQLVGVAMFVAVVAGIMAVINRLLKGIN